MKIKLLKDAQYPAGWAFPGTVHHAGDIVEAIPANNIPDHDKRGLLWINSPELADDAYGVLVETGDYEVIEKG